MNTAPGTDKKFFTRQLLRWNEDNRRSMPWKGERDPYKIWLSEIILQQTRVAQGLPYYERFLQHYPTVEQLATAPEEQVFRLWQGLGYYNRCKNMLAAARQVAGEHGGRFPADLAGLRSLKGVGEYTAAAIAAFAYDLPHAVVDGNVYRVLSRFFGIALPMDSTDGKLLFRELAGELLDQSHPAVYNQAIMDFGATVCTPRSPQCPQCPLAPRCRALKHDSIALLPVKSRKTQIKSRFFHYLVIRHRNQIYIRKRSARDIWQHLHEFVLLEEDATLGIEALREKAGFTRLLKNRGWTCEHSSEVYRHQLTHQTIFARFFVLRVPRPLSAGADYFPVSLDQLDRHALPRLLDQYVQDVLQGLMNGNR
ncbi:A/G-specific adenine glycosylase [Compostibacter hankyongensis]|uniref:Adenine DNA glycosylase n=1 Tax=Compostibacter hankyongensis TaxID=1007089 RepID=A0ABP8FDR9_9BACT